MQQNSYIHFLIHLHMIRLTKYCGKYCTISFCLFILCTILCILSTILCSGCKEQRPAPKYVVGVSQCSDGLWRQRMNLEMQTEQALHPEIELRFRQSNDNSALQCLQIDSFISEKVDLLIVAPNEEVGVTPAISRAFDAGIPVLVTDRRVVGDKWTAYIGCDNIQIGHLMGDWVRSLITSDQLTEVRVMELWGLPNSSPAAKRHQGFAERIEGNKCIRIVCSACGRWLPEDGERVADSLLNIHPEVNVIVAHNDEMAIAASRAVRRRGLDIRIMGVDALPGEGGGLQALEQGIIDMSAANSGRGDLVLRLASRIMEGKPFPRDTLFPSALIDANAATGILMQADLIDNDAAAIRKIREELYELGTIQQMQRWIIVGLMVFAVLIISMSFVMFRALHSRNTARAAQEQQELQLRKQNRQLEVMTAELAQTKAKIQSEADFMQRLTAEIESRLSDSEMDIEQLATQLGMSRAGLYRKIKAYTGQSPVALVRHVRLHKAQQLLEKGDATIQEIAYEVGFANPSYFTKCFKDEFGMSPVEYQKSYEKKAATE